MASSIVTGSASAIRLRTGWPLVTEIAEVAGEHAAQPREELPEQRLVEPVVALQRVALGVGEGARLDAEAGGDLVARAARA